MELTLDNTFKDTKIEFEDLDGLSWPKKSTPPQATPDFSTLDPLFSPGKPSIHLTIYETGWISTPSSPAFCQGDFDRQVCQLHPRKLSRSRRTSEIKFTFPRVEVHDPFACLSVSSGPEESGVQESDQTGALETRPPRATQTESQLRPFKLLELPPMDLSSIGTPPGLPSPLPSSQLTQGIPFPTGV